MHLSLPQKIGNLVQRAAHAQQLILTKDDQAFIIGIVGGADELDDFGVHRYALAAIVGGDPHHRTKALASPQHRPILLMLGEFYMTRVIGEFDGDYQSK